MDKHQKKQIKRYIAWGCLALLVAVLSVMPLLAGHQAEEDGPQASILTAAVQQREIATQIIGGGQLISEVDEDVTIPEAVKLTKYLVGNGDTVKKGDPIARVDKVSVMLAITEVQNTLDYLAEEIADAGSEKESSRINAQAAGTVKAVYGKAGDSVRDVMLEHGALAVISLDDKMAVDIPCDADLSYGDSVNVTLSNGKQVKGFVESHISGILMVTIADKDYDAGETVTVSTTDGTELGTGALYIHNPWNAAAYYGTIDRVNIKAGDTVRAGKQLFQLKVSGHSAAFQILANQRQEYEELMQELFEMYNTGVLTAPCDGFVTGVDKNAAFLLAAQADQQDWYFQPLSHTSGEAGWTLVPLSLTSGENQQVPPQDDPQITPGEGQTPNPPAEGEEDTDAEPVCDKTAECQAQVHELGCPKAIYTVRVGQVLPTGSVAINPSSYPNVSDLSSVSTVVALGGNVENWPTASLLNMDLATSYSGVAASGSVIFELSDVRGQTHYVYVGASSAGGQAPGMGDLSGLLGGMMGGFAGFGGYGGSVQTFTPYSLETVTVASVTSQEKMSLEIAVDEQDITKLRIGQEANITVDALTGQNFPAVITSISNTGTNEGGSSKFTVKLALSKSGDMLPGMNASAFLPLSNQTVSTLPVAALVEEHGQTMVYTGYDEKEEVLTNPVAVTTGISDGEYVQILSDFTGTVYYAYYDTVEHSRTPERGLGF